MITCQHAHQLFDRYLDGELSASLQTELHAHRLSCTACQGELSLMEACGDVIAMDVCEPRMSTSFTDRVVLAQRARQVRRPRRWGRMVWLTGSPMAAAASLAFTLFLIMPDGHTRKTAIKNGSQAAPAVVQELLQQGGRKLTHAEQIELARTPEMPAVNFVESLLAPVVERSRDTLDGTRRGAEEIELLLRMGFSNTNEILVARWRSAQDSKSSAAGAAESLGAELDPLAPPSASPLLSPDSSGEVGWDDQPEAL